jgi:hypothetical protein
MPEHVFDVMALRTTSAADTHDDKPRQIEFAAASAAEL